MAKTVDGNHTLLIEVTDSGLGNLIEDIFSSFSTPDICPKCSSELTLKVFRNDISDNQIDFQCVCKECGCQYTEHYNLQFAGQSIGNIIIPAKKERNG